MTFGFDAAEVERKVSEIPDTTRIVLSVTVCWQPNGKIIPLSFMWDDGRGFKIDKILSVQKGNRLKVFATGWRYLCQIGKRRFYLHYDGELWYMDRRTI